VCAIGPPDFSGNFGFNNALLASLFGELTSGNDRSRVQVEALAEKLERTGVNRVAFNHWNHVISAKSSQSISLELGGVTVNLTIPGDATLALSGEYPTSV
jgi:hypothetical protein